MVGIESLVVELSKLFPKTDFACATLDSYLSDYGIDSIRIIVLIFRLEKIAGRKISLEKPLDKPILKFSDLVRLIVGAGQHYD